MLLIVFLILPSIHANIYTFERNANFSFPGKQFKNHVVHEFSTKFQISQCAMECARTSVCKSFNFDKNLKICQLNNATHEEYPDDLHYESSTGGMEYHLQEAFAIPEEAIGPCGSHPCQHDSRCLDTKTASGQRTYICMCEKGWTGQNCQLQANTLEWKSWEDWGTCSVSCGHGYQTRRRHCEDTSSGFKMPSTECFGREVEHQTCPYILCPCWEEWTVWGECSTYTTCGRGYKIRHRNCSNGGVAGVDRYCKGPSVDTAVCEGISCKGMVRLIDGNVFGEGNVELYDDIRQKWLQVCGTQWNLSMADIVCKQIGFEGAKLSSYEKGDLQPAGAKNVVVSSQQNNVEDISNGTDGYEKNLTDSITLNCLTGHEVSLQQCVREMSENCSSNANVQCRVKGAWSLWTSWGECSVTCENGTRMRTRDCNHPPPNHGGTPCPDVDTEYKLCTLKMCPIDGFWTSWSSWSDCSVTCENGTQFRTRQCIGPYHEGRECDGDPEEIRDCFPKMCPVDGIWFEWEQWTPCPISCGYGTRHRQRSCNGPFYEGANCTGPYLQSEVCNAFSCPVDGSWKNWENWEVCTVTCGGGIRNRSRECNLPKHGGEVCVGPSLQSEICNDFNCPVDGVWTVWTNWTECDVTCGGGQQNRNRTCIGPYYGGANCTGDTGQKRDCNTHHCPVDGYWETWTNWTRCNVSCGGGIQWRDRRCEPPQYGGAECEGADSEWKSCSNYECPVDGIWTNWNKWTDCSLSCGNGTRNRSRACIGPHYGGKDCDGAEIEDRRCNTHNCPVDGVFTEWSEWSTCSLSCGRGTTARNRTCDGPYYGGEPCIGNTEEIKSCNPSNCPVDGLWLSWGPWGQCDKTCGGGIQNRTRDCDGPYHGGKQCKGDNEDSNQCNTFECPIDGIFDTWSAWFDCNVTCGGGIQWRNRTCIGPFYDGDPCHGDFNDSQTCNEFECPIDGIFDTWSEWYYCNVTCGGGIQWRNRTCIGPFYHGDPCNGEFNDSQTCNEHECPIDGIFDNWSEWYNCNVTCGGGIQWRNRTCIGPFYFGDPCVGDYNDSRSCNEHECPIDGIFSDWSEWYECDLTCGGGIQWRNRSCIGTAFGGQPCIGLYNDSQTCNDFNCPIDGNWTMWTGWDTCNVTCGGGVQSRYRECFGPFYGGANCTGNYTEMQSCNEHFCPINGTWGNWTDWDDCNVTCGGGTQYRYRNCTGPFYGGMNCVGSDIDEQLCNTHFCPIDGIFNAWSTWESCNVTCGGGLQWRNRTCDGPFYGGAPCNGSFNDSRDCNTHFCPIDGEWLPWAAWGDCPVTCGGDLSIRTRDCDGPFHFGQNCSGNWSEERDCGMNPCPIPGDWFGWSSWSRCSVTCDGGTRSRTRICDMDSYGNLTAPCLGNDTDIVLCHDFPCLPYAKHCSALGDLGLLDSSYCDIDPDGDGPLGPVEVYCDLQYINGSVVTVIDHDSEGPIYVEGHEQAGGFQQNIQYRISEEHIIAILESSQSCKQHLKWDCLNSVIQNPIRRDVWVTYWMHRKTSNNQNDPKYVIADYFPGADLGSQSCKCAMGVNTCARQPDGRLETCNCNVNDDTWKTDEGDVTYKDHLPIISFHAGDTGNDDEEGYVSIGPVVCWGYNS